MTPQSRSRPARALRRAGRSSGASDATTTMLPPAPAVRASVTGSAATATWSKVSRIVATSARANAERPVVDEVRGVHPVRPHDPVHLGERLARREVPRHADAPERVTHDEVAAVGREPAQAEAGVLDTNLEVGAGHEPEPLLVELDDAGVDLGDDAGRARPHAREVPRQGQAAATEVVGRERQVGGERRVGDRGHRPHVLELEVGRVLEVDVGVPQAVEDEDPAGRSRTRRPGRTRSGRPSRRRTGPARTRRRGGGHEEQRGQPGRPDAAHPVLHEDRRHDERHTRGRRGRRSPAAPRRRRSP